MRTKLQSQRKFNNGTTLSGQSEEVPFLSPIEHSSAQCGGYGSNVATESNPAGDRMADEALRVLYFTVIPLGTVGEGGSICCRNHVSRLAAESGIDLVVLAVAPPEAKTATDAFLDGLGVDYYFRPLRSNNFHHEDNSLSSILRFATKAIFQFYWELKAMNQPQIRECIDWIIEQFRIDILLVEWLPSAHCLNLPRGDVCTALIKQNREGDYYEDMIKQGRTHHGFLTAAISLWRARRFERLTDMHVDKVITITAPDLPKYRLRSPPVCLSPYLDEKADRWSDKRSNTIFFVGDIDRNPNNAAVRWIAKRLAPALRRIGSDVRIAIVGASPSNIPADWEQSNITFLGKSNDDEVKNLFLTSDLMLCPTESDYGIKVKALEAISYGTPLLASKQTLLGLPYLTNVPSIDLEDEGAAACTICSLLDAPGLLRGLSERQCTLQRAFIASQSGIWFETLSGIRSKHAPIRFADNTPLEKSDRE